MCNWLVIYRRRGYEVAVCWIPVPMSIEANERAEEIAAYRPAHMLPSLQRPVYFLSVHSSDSSAR